MSVGTLKVGDQIPHVLTREQLAAFTGYSVRQIDQFRREHSHPGIKQLDGPGHPRFCGRTLKAWLDGRSDQSATKAFFTGARRRA